MTCRAIRQQDQMACGTCGLQWDADDPSPPPCGLSTPPPDDGDDDNWNVHAFGGPATYLEDDFDPDDLPHSIMGAY